MKKEKNTYITPLLTVVEFKTERGYAASDSGLLVENASMRINEFVDEQMAKQVAQANENGEAVGAQMYENEDYSNVGGSSNWQYSNGGWF